MRTINVKLEGDNMKPRKVIITIEALTDIPIKSFKKHYIQVACDLYFKVHDEIFTIHQVHAQVVKEEK